MTYATLDHWTRVDCVQCGAVAAATPAVELACAGCRRRNGWAVDALVDAARALARYELEHLPGAAQLWPGRLQQRHGLHHGDVRELVAAAAELRAIGLRMLERAEAAEARARRSERKGPHRARPNNNGTNAAASRKEGRSC